MTCVIAHDLVGVTTVQSKCMKTDVVPEFIGSMWYSVERWKTLLNVSVRLLSPQEALHEKRARYCCVVLEFS